jgi:hypothetical protein
VTWSTVIKNDDIEEKADLDVPEEYKPGCTKPMDPIVRGFLCAIVCLIAFMLIMAMTNAFPLNVRTSIQPLFMILAVVAVVFLFRYIWPKVREIRGMCGKHDMYVEFYNREFDRYNDAAKANDLARREMILWEREQQLQRRYNDNNRYNSGYNNSGYNNNISTGGMTVRF